MKGVVGAPNADYALPSCGQIDERAAYYPRACQKRGMASKSRKLLGTPSKTHKLLAASGLRADAGRPSRRLHLSELIPARREAPPHVVFGPAARKGSSPAASVASPSPPRVAVCLTGQLRVMVRKGLHHSLWRQLVQPLNADVFMHVDLADTRQWGLTVPAGRTDYEAVVQRLRPIASRLVSYSPPPARPATCVLASQGGGRVCEARDCGTFGCGCYVPGCAQCVTTQYLPQHRHARECLRLVEEHEAARGAPYELIVKLRPDLNVSSPLPSYHELMRVVAPTDGSPPALCAMGGGAPLGTPLPLAELPLTMDDKFGIMPRSVATVYMNATAAFERCQSRVTNEAQCGGRIEAHGVPATRLAKARVGFKRPRRLLLDSEQRQLPRPPLAFKHKYKRAGTGRLMDASAPYWATPQCVLKRHLLSELPHLQMVDCLRRPGERGPRVLRLVRPGL